MQARRAARELALILFAQFEKDINNYTVIDFDNTVVKSIRTLANNASEELKVTMGSLNAIREFIENFESDSPSNLERPIDVANLPVAIPMTSDMIGRIDELANVADKALYALEIAEMSALEEKGEVKDYIIKIATQYQANQAFIDGQIQQFAHGWDINRLVKMDKDILRIAICELLFIKDAPMKVVIDEALELAKKYSTDDSASFINGILGKVVELNAIKK